MANLTADSSLTFTQNSASRITQSASGTIDMAIEANDQLLLRMNRGGNGGAQRSISFLDENSTMASFNSSGDLILFKQSAKIRLAADGTDLWLEGQYSAIRCRGEGTTIRFEHESPTIWCDGGLRFYVAAGNSPQNKHFEVVREAGAVPETLFKINAHSDLIELYRRAELKGSGGDATLRYDSDAATVECHGGLRVYLNSDGQAVQESRFRVVSYDSPSPKDLLIVDPSTHKIAFLERLEFRSESQADRRIETAGGDLEIAPNDNLVLISNDKDSNAAYEIRFYHYDQLLAAFSNGRATFNRKVDASAVGVRTKKFLGSPPVNAENGDLLVDADNERLYVHINGDWRFAQLAQ